MDILLREGPVVERTGTGRTLLWQRIKDGTFVPPVRIGKVAVAWPSSEVSALVSAAIGGLDETQTKALVKRLLAKRRAMAAELLREISDAA